MSVEGIFESLQKRTHFFFSKKRLYIMPSTPSGDGVDHWTASEEIMVADYISSNPVSDWQQVAANIQKNTGKRFSPDFCRTQYIKFLKKFERSNIWTEDDEKKLFELQTKYGNKWKTISAKLGGK